MKRKQATFFWEKKKYIYIYIYIYIYSEMILPLILYLYKCFLSNHIESKQYVHEKLIFSVINVVFTGLQLRRGLRV